MKMEGRRLEGVERSCEGETRGVAGKVNTGQGVGGHAKSESSGGDSFVRTLGVAEWEWHSQRKGAGRG